jgi:hypothetical protein
MNQVWVGMVGGWQKIGGSVGSNSIRDQSRYYQQYLDQMKTIETARQQRQGTGLGLPEFATGGYVTRRGMVDAGEFVVNQRAVERIGVQTLEAANNGSGSSASAQFIMVDLGDLLEKNPRALERGILGVIKSGGKFSKVVNA